MLDEYRLAVKFIEKALTNHNINGITFVSCCLRRIENSIIFISLQNNRVIIVMYVLFVPSKPI